jgi:tetratricopeptide (TPR) repeat protein
MLLDRGLLAEEGGVYRPTGEIEELLVPETLHGLIAARLDGLGAEERLLLQDASVLGKTFTKEALTALSGQGGAELEALLSSLVRKEVLGVQADPRSPERGQYGFLQDLVRRVAYETLARKERKSRHLAAAAHLEQTFGAAEQEIVEVVASHYLAAYDAQPDAGDAGAIRTRAGELLARAGERAGSLAAAGEARRYFEQAAELADTPLDRAVLLERAGEMAKQNAELEAAERLFLAALEILDAEGESHAAARVSGELASVEGATGRHAQGLERVKRAFAAVADDEPDEDVATLAARLGGAYAFHGDFENATGPNELALRLAQALRLPDTLTRALNTKAMMVGASGRPEEALALLRHALGHALEHDLPTAAATACGNLSDACFHRDRFGEALEALAQALVLARRVGDRRVELFVLAETSYALAMSGRWQEALDVFGELPEEQLRSFTDLVSPLSGVLEILIHRGRIADARALLSLYGHLEGTLEVQNEAVYAGANAALFFADGRYADALESGARALERIGVLGPGQQGVKQGFVWAVEAALALGERVRAEELLAVVEKLPPGLRPPFLEAHAHRFRSRLDGAEAGFKAAAAGFREYGFPFWLAVAELEHGEWLAAQGRTAEAGPLLAEAHETFERLEAAPWLERLARAAAGAQQASAVG